MVSVIIPNYNGKKFIKECVDSVLKSKYSAFEILIVENGSTDGSFDYLQKLYRKNKKVKTVQSKQNLWFTGGCNLGAKHSKGQVLIFLNSDCTVDSFWINHLVDFIKLYPKCIIQPKILLQNNKRKIDNVGGNYNFLGLAKGIGHGEIDNGQYDRNIEFDFANATAFAIKKAFFEKIEGFDEWFRHHYEDVDLNLRAKKFKSRAVLCYRSVVYHKVSQTFKKFVPSSTMRFNVRKNRLMVIIKNFAGLERILRISLLLVSHFLLVIIDLLSFKKEQMKVTINSIFACLNRKAYQNKKLKIIKSLFPNLPAISYNIELINVLKDCKTVLDVGCGSSSPLRFLKFENSVGIEGDRTSFKKTKKNRIHNKYYLMNINKIGNKFRKKQFECCVALDVIEHLKKEDGYKLINNMQALASKKIVLFTPNGYMPQYDHQNRYQEHLSGWTAQEMKEMGFAVIGMFGYKALKGEGHGLKYKPKIFWGIISEITQFYTRFHPKYASALLCVKNLE